MKVYKIAIKSILSVFLSISLYSVALGAKEAENIQAVSSAKESDKSVKRELSENKKNNTKTMTEENANLKKDQYIMKVQFACNMDSAAVKALLMPWKNQLEKDSNGRIVVELHPGMSLGGAASDILDQVKSNKIQAGWTSLHYYNGVFPRMETLFLPGLISSSGHKFNVALYEIYPSVKKDFEDAGVKLVTMHGDPFSTIHLLKKAVFENINDLKTKTVRVPSKEVGSLMQKYQATPFYCSAKDLYEASKGNKIQALTTSYELILSSNVWEAIDRHLAGSLYSTQFALIMSKEFYQNLPEDLKNVIDHNSIDGPNGKKFLIEVGDRWDHEDLIAVRKMMEAKNKFFKVEKDGSIKFIDNREASSERLEEIRRIQKGESFFSPKIKEVNDEWLSKHAKHPELFEKFRKILIDQEK